jgi:hypothetical protein
VTVRSCWYVRCVGLGSGCDRQILLVRPLRWAMVRVWVWTAATSKADPRQQQEWFLMCLQGARVAACGVTTLC